jgi:hypothetical protein
VPGLDSLVAELVDQADPVAPDARSTAWGRIAVASPLEVTFAGDAEPVRVTTKIASYVPVLGQTVALVKFGSKWVAVGAIGAA